MLTTMQQLPETVESIVFASCVLHNLIATRHPHPPGPEAEEARELVGDWRDADTLYSMRNIRGNTMSREGKIVRTYLKDYYNSDAGSVPWQDSMIT